MFEEKWDIPRNVCQQSPLTRDNLELFVGRQEQIRFLSSKISTNSVTIIEGILGAGKTTFGNYVRFSNTKQFSPTIELKSFPWWTNEDFILHVIAAIIEEISKGKTYKLNIDKELDLIIKKYKSFFTNSYSGGFNFGIPNIGSIGISGSKAESFSRSAKANFIEYESDLKNLAKIIKGQMKNDLPIVIQVNNLDIGDGFLEEELLTLLNSLRDILLLKDFSWILTGKKGLKDFITEKCKKIGDISSFIELDSLKLDDIKKVFEKRIYFEGYGGYVPMNDQLIESIYISTRGNIRQTFKMIDEVLSYYVSLPLKEEITLDDIKTFFTFNNENKIKSVKGNHVLIIKALQENNGTNQKGLRENKTLSKFSQPYISQELNKLNELKIITKEKVKQNYHYFMKPELYFCTF